MSQRSEIVPFDIQSRNEIQRQLKRLREEQQEILRDTDELKARISTLKAERKVHEAELELAEDDA